MSTIFLSFYQNMNTQLEINDLNFLYNYPITFVECEKLKNNMSSHFLKYHSAFC